MHTDRFEFAVSQFSDLSHYSVWSVVIVDNRSFLTEKIKAEFNSWPT
jgi:hypothetical protein